MIEATIRWRTLGLPVLACCAAFLSPLVAASTLDEVRAWREQEDVEQLLLAVADPNGTVAAAAKTALDELNEPLGGLLLGTIVDSPEARKALAQRKDFRATAPLVRALAQGDSVFRIHIAEALGEIGDPAAVPAVTDFIDRHNKLMLHEVDSPPMYWALVRFKDPRALDTFLAGMESPNMNVRDASAWGISEIMEPRAVAVIVRALRDSNSEVRASAARALERLPVREAAPDLVRLLADSSPKVRERAAYALDKLRLESAREPFRKTLADDSPEVREAAIWGLGNLKDVASVGALVQLLGDPSAKVRAAAASVLERLGEPLGGKFAAALEGDAQARSALARTADPSLLQPLIRLSRVDDVKTRVAALEMLAAFPSAEAQDALVEAASSWDLEERSQATRILLSSPETPVASRVRQLLGVAVSPSSLIYFGLPLLLAAFVLFAARRFRRTATSAPLQSADSRRLG